MEMLVKEFAKSLGRYGTRVVVDGGIALTNWFEPPDFGD